MNRDSRIVELELDKIVPNRFQPRKTFEDDISELAESIRAHGVLQPITVRPLGEKYEIVMGERRYRACQKLGLNKIPSMIVEMNDREAMEVALIENLQRQDLNPIEEALSYKRILEAGYITQEQLAQRIGKTQSTIANKLRLLSLESAVQNALLKNQISERHARSLLRLNDGAQQVRLLNKIIEEKLTVKKVDAEIDKIEKGNAIQPKANPVEIIDFDDNPFLDSNNSQEVVGDNRLDLDDYSNYNVSNDNANNFEIDEYESTLNPDNYSSMINTTNEPKNKATIPMSTIVDDFENPDGLVVVETNHGFTDAVNGSSTENELPKVEQIEAEPETENIELKNIEPDSIENVDVQEEPVTPSGNLDDVRAIINKCQTELNKLGYNVRLENYDFEKMIQVILKIDKQ